MRARSTLALVAGAAALAAAPALAVTKGPKRTVELYDNYYAPAKITVLAGTTVRWHWSEDSADVHDVKLISAPKGVKKFQSDPLAAGESFRRKLSKPGIYKIICTFHEEEMSMSIRVKSVPKKKT